MAATRGSDRRTDLGDTAAAGEVTFDLARLTGPSGSVVGIDMDAAKVALAVGDAGLQGFGNVEFRTGNASDWDEPGCYDFVYSRFLLQHLSQPVDLLRRMWRAVRDGGAIAVEDADFDGLFSEPANSGFDF